MEGEESMRGGSGSHGTFDWQSTWYKAMGPCHLRVIHGYEVFRPTWWPGRRLQYGGLVEGFSMVAW